MSETGSDTRSKLPGFRHVLEASLFIGIIGGLADTSYIFTRSPDLIADLGLGFRFVIAAGVLTTAAMIPWLILVFLILRPLSSIRKWPLQLSLTILYTLALLPAALIISRTYAQGLASSSILVEDVKVLFYFVKYLWIILPMCWGMAWWMAGVRISVDALKLYGRFSAVAFSALIFLVLTPYIQQQYLLEQANVYSEIGSRIENFLIILGVLVLALIIWPLANLVAVKTAFVRKGLVLAIIWIVFAFFPYIPALGMAGKLVGSAPSGAPLSGRPSNVVLVSLDTVRYDELGFNGSEITQTPIIDSLAAESIIFDQAITPMPMTGPAHISMMTGLQPDSEFGHGIKSNGVPVSEEIPTLATILDEAGYQTGAIIGGFSLARRACGLQRGFHYFHDEFQTGLRSRFLPDQIWTLTVSKIFRKAFHIKEGLPHGRTKTADVVTDQAIDWLDENSDKPFFLFVHYFDAHWLYTPPPPYDTMYMPDYDGKFKGVALGAGEIQDALPEFTPDDFAYERSLYRGEISFVDRELGRIIDWGNADGRNLWDNTLLIVVADHGESFEHDYYFNHTDRVYDQLIHVPLFVRNPDALPSGAGESRVDTLVNVSDIFFTALDFLELDPPESPDTMHSGILGMRAGWDHSLLDFRAGESMPGTQQGWSFIPSQSYSFAAIGGPDLGRFFSFRFPDRKLIYGPDAEPDLPMFQYFDLWVDPEEMNNTYPEIDWTLTDVPEIPEILKSWASMQAATVDIMDPQVRAELKALGYVQEGPVAAPETLPQDRGE